jgi:hypothetical protein
MERRRDRDGCRFVPTRDFLSFCLSCYFMGLLLRCMFLCMCSDKCTLRCESAKQKKKKQKENVMVGSLSRFLSLSLSLAGRVSMNHSTYTHTHTYTRILHR